MTRLYLVATFALLVAACSSDDSQEEGFCARHPTDHRCVRSGTTIRFATRSTAEEATLTRVLDACLSWERLGITCLPPDADGSADVVVSDSNDECHGKMDDGSNVVARAVPGGSIVLYRACYDPMSAEKRFIAMVHEIGHMIGLDHVPETCHGPNPIDHRDPATGMQVCGLAAMNAKAQSGLDDITTNDMAEFAMRHAAMFDIVGTPIITEEATDGQL
ncbi:MAG: hypothetical protein RLZZ324_172 [Candidatus Parcubacteria bacterium]|jgi:hypothetical protein